MILNDKLFGFSIEELKRFKEGILSVESNDELLELIDSTIKAKEKVLAMSMNSRFLVDWFNIDRANIVMLHNNGINNLAQLRELSEEDMRGLTGITQSGFEQISWARDFFDMTSLENAPSYDEDSMAVAKIIVKQANKCSKKHPKV